VPIEEEDDIYKQPQSQPTHLQIVLFTWQPVSTPNSGHHQAVTQELDIQILKT
jgi:hypothetical protein